MAKKAKELSVLAVQRLKQPGRYAVGGVDGLHLRIVGESRAWVLRIKVGNRRCDIGLGPYPEVSLADARDAARDHRKKVRDGIDPLQERQQARAALRVERAKSKTFKDCAEGRCQSDAKRSPIDRLPPKGGMPQAARLCHSARAAERRALKV